MCLPALKAGFNFIRLATPTTDDKRLPAVLANTSGFVYYVSITGITGSAAPDAGKVSEAVERIKRHSTLPVCVGFGVRTAEQARVIAQGADGVVVGSALVETCASTSAPTARPTARNRGRGRRSCSRAGERRAGRAARAGIAPAARSRPRAHRVWAIARLAQHIRDVRLCRVDYRATAPRTLADCEPLFDRL